MQCHDARQADQHGRVGSHQARTASLCYSVDNMRGLHSGVIECLPAGIVAELSKASIRAGRSQESRER